MILEKRDDWRGDKKLRLETRLDVDTIIYRVMIEERNGTTELYRKKISDEDTEIREEKTGFIPLDFQKRIVQELKRRIDSNSNQPLLDIFPVD